MSKYSRFFILLTVCAVLAVVWFLREPSQPESDADFANTASLPTAAWRRTLEEHYAFDEACAECHQEQYEAHLRSGHSRTAVPVRESSLVGGLTGLVYPDPRRDQIFRFEKRDDRLFVGIEGNDSEPMFPVQWMLGSGTHASTPVSIDPATGYGVEFRWTWFANAGRWDVTPDHERFDEYRPRSLECFGRPLEPEQALACVNCHMTVVPPPQIPPTEEAFIANVGCERCHGPRKKHVEMAHIGRGGEVKPLLTYDDPETYIQNCAQCHRDENNIPKDSPPNALARYQPYGLQKSECYLKSGKTLTCSNCHDPHDRASKDRGDYRKRCLECHQTAEQVHCPTQPAGDCVECHMPAVEWQSGIYFHDHWIRIPAKPTSRSGGGSSANARDDK